MDNPFAESLQKRKSDPNLSPETKLRFQEIREIPAILPTSLRELEAGLEAAGSIAGDRRTKEWDEAVRDKVAGDNFIRGHTAGYKEGYQDGHADGKDSQKFGNRITGRNKYPNG